MLRENDLPTWASERVLDPARKLVELGGVVAAYAQMRQQDAAARLDEARLG
jgi:hypothetical protein